MSKASFVCILLLALVAFSTAQLTAFKANFEVRRPNTTGAVVLGVMTYDVAIMTYRMDYTDRQYYEILKFQPLFGVDDRATVDQWMYQSGTYCEGGCRASRIDFAFPRLTYDSTFYSSVVGPPTSIAGTNCQLHVPIDPTASTVQKIWFSPILRSDLLRLFDPAPPSLLIRPSPCRALFKDGTEYTFISPVGTINSTLFDEPVDCQCGDKLDLIIMIDRSASISPKDYDDARIFAREFARKFTLSPAQVHVAVAQFDVDTELIMDLYEGTSLLNLDAAINSMDCSCNDVLDTSKGQWNEVPQNADYCCGRRTSISAALDDASTYLTNNGRVGSRKAVLIVSDGRQNTMSDGTPCSSGNTCDADLTAAVQRITTTHPGSMIFGVGMGVTDHFKMALIVGGRYERLTNTSYYYAERNFYLVGAVGCSAAVYYCDPASCQGLCECAECRAPSRCDPTGDFCNIATLNEQARICEIESRDCQTSNLCQVALCDTTAAQCTFSPKNCPAVQDPICFDRTCNTNTGVCTTTATGVRGCTNECTNDAGCDDNNKCTIDACVQTGNVLTCQYTPVVCNDNNLCTIDFCTDPAIGCQTRPKPISDCDDHVQCTVDTCMPDFGCRNTMITCNDNLACTEDYCDLDLGHCVYTPIACPISNDNCTLNYCLYGGCDSRSLCPEELKATTLDAGAITGIFFAALLGAAGLAAAGYIFYRIKVAPKKENAGGSAVDFASE